MCGRRRRRHCCPQSDPTHFGLGPIGQFVDEGSVGDVAGYRQRPPTQTAHHIGDGVDLVFAASGEHHIATGLGERDGDAFADATAGAGDHGDAVGECEAIKN